jgi:glycosyltransferase involved in cell wall biosynthesis
MVMVEQTKPNLAIELLPHKPLVVVGIPAFNEERTIAKVVLEAQKHADAVIVCDDGSSDLTGEIASRLGVIVIRHDVNKGYGGAIQSLFRESRKLGADIFVTLDGDGQHEAARVPLLVQPILDGEADVVIGSRFLGDLQANGSKNIPFYRRLGIKAITKLTTAASNCQVTDAQNGCRAYSRVALEKLAPLENGMGASIEVLLRAKEQDLRISEVPVACKYSGVEKPSSQHPLRHGTSVISLLVKLIVEEKPLIVLGTPSIALLAIGLVFGAWVLQIYSLEHLIETNIALASIAFVLAGLFALSTAITLYAITRLAEKTNRRSE